MPIQVYRNAKPVWEQVKCKFERDYVNYRSNATGDILSILLACKEMLLSLGAVRKMLHKIYYKVKLSS